MNIQTNSKDLYSIAQQQINKINIQKQFQIKNPQFSQGKSIQQIYKRGISTLNSLMPSGSNRIKQTQNQVPNSVKMLDIYAQKIGFLPMGQIYQGSGNKYIGRVSQITQKGQTFYKQFPVFDQFSIDTPDLTQNLTFHANKAISKWNQFVTAQSQLANFLEKIQSPQGKKKLMNQYAKTSSIGSDMLRILSTLYFYYNDQKTPNRNILQMKTQDVQQFKNLLKKKGNLINVYENCIKFIQTRHRNQKFFNIIKVYHQLKVQTLKASVSQGQYPAIRQLLDDKIAYIPDQMISIPIKQSSKWTSVIGQNSSGWKSKLITENWQPNSQWFRAINYLKQ